MPWGETGRNSPRATPAAMISSSEAAAAPTALSMTLDISSSSRSMARA